MTFRVSLIQVSKDAKKQESNTLLYTVSEKTFNRVKDILECPFEVPEIEDIAASIEEENAELTGRFKQPNKETPEEVQEVIKEQSEDPQFLKGRRYIYDDNVIRALISDGKTDGDIAKLLKIPYQTIHNYIKKKGYRSSDNIF